MSWDRTRKFLSENRIYLVMLSFMAAAGIFLAQWELPENKERIAEKKKSQSILSPEEITAQEERIRDLLSRNAILGFTVTAATFAGIFALLAGSVMAIKRVARKLNGREMMEAYGSPPDVRWRSVDILRIMAAFYFFAYLLQLIGGGAAALIGAKNVDENLFDVINATLMDIIGLAIVLYFAMKKFKSGLSGLGITLKNIKRDIMTAVGGYLAIIPVLAVIMIVVFTGLKIFSYEPPETKALEILYETNKPKLLFILTALITIIGPVVEELFFRGFAYPVFRKKVGVKKAILLVSFVFAMLHMNIVSFFPVLALGILLAYLYEKTGSLIPSITVHVIHNSAVVFFVFLYKQIALPK